MIGGSSSGAVGTWARWSRVLVALFLFRSLLFAGLLLLLCSVCRLVWGRCAYNVGVVIAAKEGTLAFSFFFVIVMLTDIVILILIVFLERFSLDLRFLYNSKLHLEFHIFGYQVLDNFFLSSNLLWRELFHLGILFRCRSW